MIRRFLEAYPSNIGGFCWTPNQSLTAQAVTDALAGRSFGNGLYRVHSTSAKSKWTAIIAEAFPGYAGKIKAFSSDWLGRQFAVNLVSENENTARTLMFNVSYGEVLEIPGDIIDLHEKVFVDLPDASLERSKFESWLQHGGRSPTSMECCGYKVPPIVGGSDEFNNIKLVDMEVEWQITGQLLVSLSKIPKDARIDKFSLLSGETK